MTSIIVFVTLIGMVLPASLGNILAYPVSKKISMKISNYILNVCAPRLFRIIHMYKHFNLWAYNDTKKLLPEHFIVISNHQSLLDIPLFMTFFKGMDPRFVAKDALGRHIPLVSEMLRTQEHCLVPRKAKPMEAMRYIEEFGKRVVVRNQIPILFPEGSRTRDGNVGKFYSAGFRKLTESTNLPVVVCALDGGYELRDLRRILSKVRRGCYRVKVMKVFDNPKTKEECNEILEESRTLIQNQLDQWRKLPATEKGM